MEHKSGVVIKELQVQFQRAIGGMRRTRFDQTFPPRFQNIHAAASRADTDAATADTAGVCHVDHAARSHLTDPDAVAEMPQRMQRMHRRSSESLGIPATMAMAATVSFDDTYAGASGPGPGGPNHHGQHNHGHPSGRRREGQGSLLLRSLMDCPTKPVIAMRKRPAHGRPVIAVRRDRAHGTTGGGGGGGLTRLQRTTLARPGHGQRMVGSGQRQLRSSSKGKGKGSMIKDHLSAASLGRRFNMQSINTVQEELSVSSFLRDSDRDSVASAPSPSPPPSPTPIHTAIHRDIKRKNLEGDHIILLPDEEDEGLGTSPTQTSTARTFAIPPPPPLPLPSRRHHQLKFGLNHNHSYGHNSAKRPGRWGPSIASPTTNQEQQQTQESKGAAPPSRRALLTPGLVAPTPPSDAPLFSSGAARAANSQHTYKSPSLATPFGLHAGPPASNARARRESASKLNDAFDTAKKDLDKHMAKAYFNEALSLQLGGSGSESSRPPDIAAALEHYELAAKLGHAKSMVNAAQIYLSLSTDPAADSVEDPAMTTAKAVRLLKQACRMGDVRALAFYGTLLCTGDSRLGIAANPRKAVELLRRAANWRSAEALLQLSRCHQTGTGVAYANPTMAFSLCKAAAKEGLAAAQHNLGVYYTRGCSHGGCPVDREKARWWFEKAAANGHPGAAHNLVVMASGASSANGDLAPEGLGHP